MPADPSPSDALLAFMRATLHDVLAEMARRQLRVIEITTEALQDEQLEAFLSLVPRIRLYREVNQQTPPIPESLVQGAPTGETQAPVAAPTRKDQGDLRPSLQRILSVCTREPQSSKRIARLLGRSYSSYLTNQLSELVSLQMLLHVDGGYRLP